MGSVRNYPDGTIFLSRSPIRSYHFAGITILSLGALLFTVYLALEYHTIMTANFMILLCGFVGLQAFSQWSRCVRMFTKIRQIYASVPENERGQGTPINLALRIASGGLVDLLFNGSLSTFYSLGLIWVLLRHLSGAH